MLLELSHGRIAHLLVQVVESTLVAALEIQGPVVLLAHIRLGVYGERLALKLGILPPSHAHFT